MITISPRELIRPGEVSRIYYGYRRYACGHPVPKDGIFMKQRLSRILPFTLFPAIALGIGWLSSTLTRYGLENVYPNLLKSPLTPPGYVFPIAWTILYLLMGIGMAMIWNKSPQDRVPTLRLWGFQLVLNFFWSILFFGWNNPLGALLCLAVLFLAVLFVTLRFYSVSPAASWLQLPYLLWLLFAGYLNGAVWLLNR